MSAFLTELCANLKPGSDKVWIIRDPLRYHSDLLGDDIEALAGFYTDFASIPRYIPIASNALLGTAHREGVIHDLLYCSDNRWQVSRLMADRIFLEAMKARGKAFPIRMAMFLGVRAGGWLFFHRRKVADKL